MHHFMSTAMPGTLTNTVDCTLTSPPPSFYLCNCALCLPPPLNDGAECVFAPSSLSFLPSFLPLSCSVLSGEADRPHSKGRPRRPFLTRLSVTPLPHLSNPSFNTTNTPPTSTHLSTMYSFCTSFYLASLSCCISQFSFRRQRERQTDRQTERRTETAKDRDADRSQREASRGA